MIPLALSAIDYRSYALLDLRFEEGVWALVGPNGAGKSSIPTAIEVALFARDGGELAQHLRKGQQAMSITFTFEHRGERYSIERQYTAGGRGKATLDFVSHGQGGDIYPLNKETVAATQQAIEQLLGFSRESLRASAYCGQGQGALFAELQPRERRALLADILHLHIWDDLLAAVRDDLIEHRQAEVSLTIEAGVLERQVEQLPDLVSASAAALREAETAAASLERAHVALTTHRQYLAEAELAVSERRAAEVEVRAARETRERLGALRDDRARATVARGAAEAELGIARLVIVATDDAPRLLLEARTVHARAQEAEREQARHRLDADRAEADARNRRERIRLIGTEQRDCDRCGQPLGTEAAARVVASLHDEADAFTLRADQLRIQADAIEVPEAPDLADLEQRAGDFALALRNEAALLERLAAIDRRIADGSVPDDVLEESRRRLETAAMRLDAMPQPVEISGDEATLVRGVQVAQVADHDARANVTVREERLNQARAAEAKLLNLAADRAEHDERGRLLELEERAYSRTGVPALILEAVAVPRLEAHANDVLERWGSADRVELRTQRELKGGGVAEALDIVCVTPAGERPFETFSGGERTRIALALRLALARLLGAECGLLVIDEPDGLDAEGMERLPGLLDSLGSEFPVRILVSHNERLSTAFERVVRVAKGPAGSRIVTLEAVA